MENCFSEIDESDGYDSLNRDRMSSEEIDVSFHPTQCQQAHARPDNDILVSQ